jgi:hypothetical protein
LPVADWQDVLPAAANPIDCVTKVASPTDVNIELEGLLTSFFTQHHYSTESSSAARIIRRVLPNGLPFKNEE